MNIPLLVAIALAVSSIWLWAVIDLMRRDDLTEEQNSMWFAALLVGNLASAIVYLIWRGIRIMARPTGGKH